MTFYELFISFLLNLYNPNNRNIKIDIKSMIIPLLRLRFIPRLLFISRSTTSSSNKEKSKYGKNVYSIKLILNPNKVWDSINEKHKVTIEKQDTKTEDLNITDKQIQNIPINNIGIEYTKNLPI